MPERSSTYYQRIKEDVFENSMNINPRSQTTKNEEYWGFEADKHEKRCKTLEF